MNQVPGRRAAAAGGLQAGGPLRDQPWVYGRRVGRNGTWCGRRTSTPSPTATSAGPWTCGHHRYLPWRSTRRTSGFTSHLLALRASFNEYQFHAGDLPDGLPAMRDAELGTWNGRPGHEHGDRRQSDLRIRTRRAGPRRCPGGAGCSTCRCSLPSGGGGLRHRAGFRVRSPRYAHLRPIRRPADRTDQDLLPPPLHRRPGMCAGPTTLPWRKPMASPDRRSNASLREMAVPGDRDRGARTRP